MFLPLRSSFASSWLQQMLEKAKKQNKKKHNLHSRVKKSLQWEHLELRVVSVQTSQSLFASCLAVDFSETIFTFKDLSLCLQCEM